MAVRRGREANVTDDSVLDIGQCVRRQPPAVCPPRYLPRPRCDNNVNAQPGACVAHHTALPQKIAQASIAPKRNSRNWMAGTSTSPMAESRARRISAGLKLLKKSDVVFK